MRLRDFSSRRSAALQCAGSLQDVGLRRNYLYRVWLPEGGWEAADSPAMEWFVKLPEEIWWETFDLQACIPVARP